MSSMVYYTIDEIRTLKKKYGLSNAGLSDESGVPIGTVNKVLSGETSCPRSSTLKALSLPLIKREQPFSTYPNAESISDVKSLCHQPVNYQTAYRRPAPANAMVREEAIACGAPADKEPGTFTIDDYYALPDEHRVELIDGYFYDMAAPTTIHQSIALTVAVPITAFIKAHNGSCIPFISPVDVHLDVSDQKTIVQPDFLIVCDPSKVKEKCIVGAPDFILEIISPSTSSKDYYKKAAKYQESGVREYWIIDPIRKRLTIYYFETEEPVQVCALNGKKGIGIYNNELEIDLDEIGSFCK